MPARAGGPRLNYRHAFHAGNFADVFKHAVLLAWLEALMRDPAPLEVLDTHAGAGAYDLSAVPSGRSREALAGIGRVVADTPAALAPLVGRVQALNGGANGPLYPGSPLLVAGALRPGDAYVGCELRAEVQVDLAEVLRSHPGRGRARALEADGYGAVRVAAPGVRRAVFLDPPFEAAEEGARLAEALGAVLARGEAAAAWLPLKDLDGFDRLLGRVEALRPSVPVVAVQVRLRPLDDPLRLNGCAMLLLGGPDVAAQGEAAAVAVVERCGEPGGRAVVERLAT